MDKQESWSINILDILGREIKTIFTGELQEEGHRLFWNGINIDILPVASGIYFTSAGNKKSIEDTKLISLK